MKLLGLWPSKNEKFAPKVYCLIFFTIFINILPSANFLRVAFQEKNAQQIGLCIPEVINNFIIIFAITSFMMNRKLLERITRELEYEWHKSDEKEWTDICTTSAKKLNIISLLGHFLINFGAILHCLVPNVIFLVQRFKFHSTKISFLAYQHAE